LNNTNPPRALIKTLGEVFSSDSNPLRALREISLRLCVKCVFSRKGAKNHKDRKALIIYLIFEQYQPTKIPHKNAWRGFQ
jgi:hypothetical protein